MGGEGCGLLGHGQFLERMHLRTRDMGLGHISTSVVHCCLLLLSLPPILWEPKGFLTCWLGMRTSVFFQKEK